MDEWMDRRMVDWLVAGSFGMSAVAHQKQEEEDEHHECKEECAKKIQL